MCCEWIMLQEKEKKTRRQKEHLIYSSTRHETNPNVTSVTSVVVLQIKTLLFEGLYGN